MPDEVDFYGTGEVTGPLRRNGRTVELWNVDTPAYGLNTPEGIEITASSLLFSTISLRIAL